MTINKKKLFTVALGAAFFITSAIVPTVFAESNPFAINDAITFKTDMEKKTEGKCGEGKKKDEGKCGEGKCGGDKKKTEGKCGEGKKKDEGKCGEGKKKDEGKGK